ncbi:MAG: EAL domain-containing protein [Desulfovibrionaceae bacterium]|nr:EAL domain-containing protein [Desulfovibrionaceae bacterium]
MSHEKLKTLFRFTPFRVLLPSALMLLLFAGSIFLYILPNMEHELMESRKRNSVELTAAVLSTVNHFHALSQRGEITEAYAKRLAREFIRSMRYGPENKDYFWVTDTDARMVMHPYRPDLIDRDLSEFRDKEGTRVFTEFVRVALERGEGFVNYYWQWNDEPGRIEAKLSYVREFKPWGWVIGTGLYVADVKEDIAVYRNRAAAILVGILLVIFLLSFYILRQAAMSEQKRARVQTQRERLVRVLQESEERYRTIADFTYGWEAWVDVDGSMLYCSPACERMTGYPPEKFFDTPGLLRSIVIEDDRDAWDAYLVVANSDHGDSLDFRIRTADNKTRWIGAAGRSVSGIGGKPLGLRFSFRDITDHKLMEEQLRHQALHDPLTNLANRTLCLDRINQAMRRAARRDNYFFAVVFLDLDRFKVINDSLGHRFGDMVLTETAIRLTAEMRGLDTVARFGGDEFVLLLDELSSPGEAIRIIKRVRKRLSEPFRFQENEVQTTASFGLVLSPIANSRPAEVLQHANIAMHRAKEAGRNRFKVFTDRMLETAVDQLTMENDMRQGLVNGEFYVAFQPIMEIGGNEVIGFEALARWNHPDRGNIPPSEFIPMAEETGLIISLGEWVLREALKTLTEWRRQTNNARDVYMSVNLSSKQFTRYDLDKMVLRALNDSGLDPSSLKLEITESAIMDNPEAAIRILRRLRKAGVRFSIDDFGKGYSSLSQLQQLPVDTLKVDRSFISRMRTDPENMEIVKAVIALAHSLDLDVVAEGVEEGEQLRSLIDLECECVQGFYFHKPMSMEAALKLLRLRSEKGGSGGREA